MQVAPAITTAPLAGYEVVAWVIGVILATGAVVGALAAILTAIRRTWRWFWHGFIPWVGRAIRLVDTLTDLPDTVAGVKTDITALQRTLAGHLLVADENVVLLNEVREQVALLPGIASMTTEVVGQVKNNGGSSLLDSNHRIERALGLDAPPPNRPNAETGPIPTPNKE